jgi:hypothetical protein
MIFTKNHEVYFLALKCKTTHVPAKLAGTCAKFKKYLQRLRNKTRADMCIPRVSTIYVGCFSQLSISHFGCRFDIAFRVICMCKAKFLTCIAPKPGYGETLAGRDVPPCFFKVLSHVCQWGGHTSQVALPRLSPYIMPT